MRTTKQITRENETTRFSEILIMLCLNNNTYYSYDSV